MQFLIEAFFNCPTHNFNFLKLLEMKIRMQNNSSLVLTGNRWHVCFVVHSIHIQGDQQGGLRYGYIQHAAGAG